MRFGTGGSCGATFFGLFAALVVAACASLCVCGGFTVCVCALSVTRVLFAGGGAEAFGAVFCLCALADAGTVEDGATVLTCDSPLLLDLRSVSVACLVLGFFASASLRLSLVACFFGFLSLVIDDEEVPAVALAV
jgi:hypothetical protein